MSFHVKLNWENVFQPDEPVFSPVVNGKHVRRKSGLGVASRGEFLAKTGRMYVQEIICEQMWRRPQIDWDGKVLGCCVNFWGDYGNAFDNGLLEGLNSEKLSYARSMLLGEKEAREDIACTRCHFYKHMKETNTWMDKAKLAG